MAGLVFPEGRMTSAEEVSRRFDGREGATTAFKEELAELCVAVLGPIGGEMGRLLEDEEHLLGVLSGGEQRARRIAAGTVDDVRERLGLAPVARM